MDKIVQNVQKSKGHEKNKSGHELSQTASLNYAVPENESKLSTSDNFYGLGKSVNENLSKQRNSALNQKYSLQHAAPSRFLDTKHKPSAAQSFISKAHPPKQAVTTKVLAPTKSSMTTTPLGGSKKYEPVKQSLGKYTKPVSIYTQSNIVKKTAIKTTQQKTK